MPEGGKAVSIWIVNCGREGLLGGQTCSFETFFIEMIKEQGFAFFLEGYREERILEGDIFTLVVLNMRTRNKFSHRMERIAHRCFRSAAQDTFLCHPLCAALSLSRVQEPCARRELGFSVTKLLEERNLFKVYILHTCTKLIKVISPYLFLRQDFKGPLQTPQEFINELEKLQRSFLKGTFPAT